jgi:hypothetical protein
VLALTRPGAGALRSGRTREIIYKFCGGGVYTVEHQKDKHMRKNIKLSGLAIVCTAWFAAGCSKKSPTVWKSTENPQVTAQLKSFVAEKTAQANAAAKADGQATPPEFKTYFAAAAKGDWLTVSNRFREFARHAPQYEHSGKTDERLHGTAWQAVLEVYGTLEFMAAGNEKYSAAFGHDVIDSIPPGSIYFGGTDPGRFLITGMEKSQIHADPFFLLTQNALADGTYLQYLRSMYGEKIYVPTDEDLQKCFQDYTEDAQRRAENHQLKPGENVTMMDGHPQISGEVAVMSINALIAKVIFDKNPGREFYLEESFPLDWMYPQLEPHGLIFKINRQPPPELSADIVRRDHDYWTQYLQPMIGGWLKEDTSVAELTGFADKVFRQGDLSGFTGDPQFIQNDYSCKMFSKLRSSIAGLYVWRLNQAATADEKERMARAADFAFRQALALCPYSQEAANGYLAFLKQQNRAGDAALVAEMAKQIPRRK